MNGSRLRVAVGLAVGFALIASGFLPQPIFASPYETADPAPYTHAAVHESDPQFDRLVELYGFDPEDAAPVSSLSETGRLAAERTIDREPDGDGWRRYELPVCVDSMLACDSVREPPEDFHYGEGPPERVFEIVEADGERYLLRTGVQTGAGGAVDPRDQPRSTYVWIFGLLPYGVALVATQLVGAATGERRVPLALTAGGAALLIAGVAVPYLVVFGAFDYDAVSLALLVGVVGCALLAGLGLVYATVQYARTTESAKRRRGA